VNIAQDMTAMKAVCFMFGPLYSICSRSSRAFRDLNRVAGAKKFVLETVKRLIDHNIIDGGPSYSKGSFSDLKRYSSSALGVLGLMSRILLDDQNPRRDEIETMFWEADISTTLVRGLRSLDSAYTSLKILVQLLKISPREREKLRKIEGVVEYLQGVPNIHSVVRILGQGPDVLKNLADEATGYINDTAAKSAEQDDLKKLVE